MNDAAPAPTRPPRPTVGRIAGELLITVGALLLLFVIYEAFWTNLTSGRLQQQASDELEEQWDAAPAFDPGDEPVPPAVPALGQPFARLHLPTLGADTEYTVLEGTRNEDLRTGPGRYTDTQMVGERGNAALAGHRNGSGAVFQYIDRLQPCDPVVIETETQWMTYRVLPVAQDYDQRLAEASDCMDHTTADRLAGGEYSQVQGNHITTPDAVEVLSPVPGGPWPPVDENPREDDETLGRQPLERMLTLTTCHPQFSNAERLIVHAVLTETTAKTDQPPASLEGR